MSRSRVSEWAAFRAPAVGCAVVGAGLAAFALSGLGDPQIRRVVTDGGFVVFSALAAFTCFRAATLRPRARRLPWWLLGGAAICYAVGNVIWFYYQVLAPETQTFPGPADAFYVAVVPFAVAGMLTLPSRRLSPPARARAVADGFIMAVALLFISWILVIGPLFAQLGEASPVYLAVYLYYPSTDIVLISIASGLALRASGRERLPMLLVGVAFVAIACADTGISYLALQGREAAGSGLDLGWTFGYMLLGLAALTPISEESPDDRADPRAHIRELLPYVPVGIVLLLVAASPSWLADAALARLLVVMIVLIVVRHMLTLSDNVRLTRDLENRVRRRTADLERLSRRHQSILDGAGEGIVGLDGLGRVTFANRAAAELIGRSADELAGRVLHTVAQLRGADGGPISGAADPVCGALADGRVRRMTDGTYRRADGVDLPVEITVAPIRGEDDATRAVLIFRDVTERRAVDRMKDEFVSVVSHELRTPLTSVRGALGLLGAGLLRDAPPKAQQMIHIAVESTERLIRLINNILDVERMAAGRVALRRQAWPAADLIAPAVAEMRGLAAESGVSVEVRAVAGHVDADKDRIMQTLTNLLSNAVKFSPPGGVVRIAAVERDADVQFRVSDEGEGIPADQLETVFDRFAQVDASDTRGKQGSGLGLAICRGIVEQHGGRIWAENIPGAGALFSFTLPKIEVPAGEEKPSDGESSAPTVLVCEDDPQVRAVVGDLLRSHGYRVVGVASGEEALAAVADQPPAAVLMDLALPGLDGWSTVAELRRDERIRDVPVVIVSGTEPGPAPLDVVAWLTKPLDVPALLHALNDAITEGGSRPCVLIIEDDPALRQVLAALFHRHGVMAVTARTAQESLRLSHGVAPDLVLLDLMLPDDDGFTVVDWFRQDPQLRGVPLVVYTALDLDEDDKERLRLGPTEFFTKARTNPEDVERHVLELLDSVVAGARR